jgi:hypothetical protein
MTDTPIPDEICSVEDCDEPAALAPRGAAADDLVDAGPADLVPLCARHAASAQAGGSSPD